MPPSRSGSGIGASHNAVLYTYGRNSPRRPYAPPSTRPSPEIPLFPTLTRIHSIPASNNPPTVSDLVGSVTQARTKMGLQTSLDQCLEKLRGIVQDSVQENASVKEALKLSSDKLSQLKSTIARDGQCTICLSIMLQPVALGTCGHVYCAKCVSQEFRAQLMKNLLRFSRQKGIYPFLTVPDTQRDMQDRISCIKRHGGNMSQVFTYLCPVCRQLTTEPPIPCRGLEGILQAACNTLDLSISSIPDIPKAGSFRKKNLFAGLFAK